MEIEDFYAIKTEYPFDLVASFKSDDGSLDTILNSGWRTAKLCAAVAKERSFPVSS